MVETVLPEWCPPLKPVFKWHVQYYRNCNILLRQYMSLFMFFLFWKIAEIVFEAVTVNSLVWCE